MRFPNIPHAHDWAEHDAYGAYPHRVYFSDAAFIEYQMNLLDGHKSEVLPQCRLSLAAQARRVLSTINGHNGGPLL